MENLELKDKTIEVLKTIYDPEIPVNIYELGLIYNIDIDEERNLKVEMTLTAPTCPIAGDIVTEVTEKLKALPDFKEVNVELVFEPPWEFDKMSDAAKLELGML